MCSTTPTGTKMHPTLIRTTRILEVMYSAASFYDSVAIVLLIAHCLDLAEYNAMSEHNIMHIRHANVITHVFWFERDLVICFFS